MNAAKIAKRMTAGLPYDSLNDAATETGNEGYSIGSTEIWYMSPKFFGEGLMGYDWLEEHGTMPDPDNLQATHVFMGRIKEHDQNNVFDLMQGHKWSPKGEARQIIQRKGVQHTSMSMGDVIKVGSKVMIVDRFGFKQVPKKDRVKAAKTMTAEDRSQEAYSYMKYWVAKEVANLARVVKGLQDEIERANKQIAGLDKLGSGVIEAPTFVRILDDKVGSLQGLVDDMKTRTSKFSAKD